MKGKGKICTGCKKRKTLHEFPVKVRKTGRRSARCRACQKLYAQEWYTKNKEKKLAQGRIWRKQHPEKMRGYIDKYRAKNPKLMRERSAAWRRNNPEKYKAKYEAQNRRRASREPDARRKEYVQRTYGLSPERYEEMHKEQGFKCAICPRELGPKITHVDHCHVSGKVRGLLCRSCNYALGHLRDIPELALSAYTYLSKWQILKNVPHNTGIHSS